MPKEEKGELEKLILGALQGDKESVKGCVEKLQHPEYGRAIFRGVLAAAQQSTQQLKKLNEEMGERIMPAMVWGWWQKNGTQILDVEMGGQRCYCRVEDDSLDADELGLGDEIAVSQMEGGPPILIQSLKRPYETTGKYGAVSDIRKREDAGYELEIEGQNETFTCLACKDVTNAIDKGEVDALGGLPITAVHVNGLVWSLFQQKGKAEQNTDDMQPVTLNDYAGYTQLRSQVTLSMARQVLYLEPWVLTDSAGMRRSMLQPPFKGVLATGAPGTGKTFLFLAVVGSLRALIGVFKARAKLAALRLWVAIHGTVELQNRHGNPTQKVALHELESAFAEQYAGIRSFGLMVTTPKLPRVGDPGLATFAQELIEGYGIPAVKVPRRLKELERLVEAGKSDFMILTLRKEDYIKSYVGEGLNALSAQMKRAQNHDDLAVLCLPEAEVLLSTRGHQSRYYTDELVSKILEVLDGPVACRNLFILADGNRPEMFDSAFGCRRLDNKHFPGLALADRLPVMQSILSRNGAEGDQIESLSEKLLDLVDANTTPLCELVMVDKSTRPLTVEDILTPALIQNVVRAAAGDALSAGRNEIEEEDLEQAWERELTAQSQRFSEEEAAAILGLDRQTQSRITEVRRLQT